jgi:hypothetical protein
MGLRSVVIKADGAEDPNQHNIGCDPEAFPTQAYINRFMDVYTNPNIVSIVIAAIQYCERGKTRQCNQQLTCQTVMGQIENFTMPRNSLIDTC